MGRSRVHTHTHTHPLAMALSSKCQLSISSWSSVKENADVQAASLPTVPFPACEQPGKALDWQYGKAKLSLFLLRRSEMRNQTSITGSDSLSDWRHTVQFQSPSSPRRGITRGTKECQELPWHLCYQCNQTGRRETPPSSQATPREPCAVAWITAGHSWSHPMGTGWAPLWPFLPSAQCCSDPVDQLALLFFKTLW